MAKEKSLFPDTLKEGAALCVTVPWPVLQAPEPEQPLGYKVLLQAITRNESRAEAD